MNERSVTPCEQETRQLRAEAIAYIRVSSKTQNHATQRSAIEKAATVRGDTVTQWYSEKKSAKTVERPELDRLRLDARAGRLAGRRLYLFRLDRLTRSGIRDTLEVLEELRNNGCEVVTVSDGFDPCGPSAEVIIAVMSWASAMELRAKNERIAAARERMAVEGKSWGRPKRMSDEVIAKAQAMQEAGRSIRQISIALKVPRATVARTLASQKVRSASAR
ncbi:MAG: recombinase family protein [Proteobacteria bacterium]|nr:recombinase family protein [Pseudomonadota bacterium]